MQDMQQQHRKTIDKNFNIINKPAVYGRTFLDLEEDEVNYFNSGGKIIEGRVQMVIDKDLRSGFNVYLIDNIREILTYGIYGTYEERLQGRPVR